MREATLCPDPRQQGLVEPVAGVTEASTDGKAAGCDLRGASPWTDLRPGPNTKYVTKEQSGTGNTLQNGKHGKTERGAILAGQNLVDRILTKNRSFLGIRRQFCPFWKSYKKTPQIGISAFIYGVKEW